MVKPDPDRWWVGAFLGLLFLGVAALLLCDRGAGEQLPLALSNLLLVALALGHACFLMGWRRALVFFALAYGLSWAAETLSLATDLATPYHYTQLLGPRLGQVPVVVPMGWAAMIYNSHVIANLIAEGRPHSRRPGGPWLVGLALLTALVMTAWDLTLDPYMVHKGAWVWDQSGVYFGIPAANYLSWAETVFMIALAIRLVETVLPPPPRRAHRRLALAIPVLGYAAIGLPAVWVGVPAAARVLSPFAMGIPALAALGRILKPGKEEVEP